MARDLHPIVAIVSSLGTVDPMRLMNIAARIAREVGDLVATGRRSGVDGIRTKSSPTDMVTEWDTRAESLIRTRLAEIRPHDAVIGEESDPTTGSSGITWVVDPIDGTTNFAYGLPAYTISIAASTAEGPIAAAVHVPETREMFVAASGHGAWSNGRPLQCSPQTSLALALVGTGFSYDPTVRREQLEIVAARGPRVRDIRRMGAASLDLCAVAAGRLDAYWERNLQPWDVAAGILIAREAGAIVTDFAGGPVTGGDVVASSPGIHADLIALLA